MKNIGMAFQLPKYWNILSDYDKYQYNCLRITLGQQYSKNQRNKRIENFTEILEIIKRFCVRNDGDNWRRFLACGYCCFPEGIAVNTRQLRLLILKCKSSINGSLHKMGFNSNISRNEAANYLMSAIPILRDDMHELRQWTVRKNVRPIPPAISPPAFGPAIDAFKKEVPTQVQLNAQQEKLLPIPYVETSPDKKLDLEEEMNSFSNLPDPLFLFDNSDQNQLLELDFI